MVLLFLERPRPPQFSIFSAVLSSTSYDSKKKTCKQLTLTTLVFFVPVKSKIKTCLGMFKNIQIALQVTQHCSSEFIWKVFMAHVIAKESLSQRGIVRVHN